MKISDHANHTLQTAGIRAVDIHKWIDGFFNASGFDQLIRAGQHPEFDPYDHRKHRHCREALEEAYEEFAGKYTKKQIKIVFETHVKDDYNGYLPSREDFFNGTFTEKYHEDDERANRDRILSKAELSEYFQGKDYQQRQQRSKNKSKEFFSHIILPTALAITLFITSIFTIIVPVFRNNIMDRKKEMIRELTNAAISIIDNYIEGEKTGRLSAAEAQKRAADDIRKMTYGIDNKDYFWITDMYPRMIMHPYRPELIGKDLRDYLDRQDKSGKHLFVEFVNLVKTNGAGYLEYLWQWKDDASRTVPKLSYVKGIEEWDWIIGTGIYINDVQEEIDQLTNRLLLIFLSITTGLSLLLLYILLQSNRIENDRLQAESGLREAKERYRALVEASNEGYLLEAEGELIYTNLALQHLLLYNEDELSTIKPWELLNKDNSENEVVIDHLKQIFTGHASSGEFDAEVVQKDGNTVPVTIRTSRIFFSRKMGHIISFLPVRHKETEIILNSYKHIQNKTLNLFESKQVIDVYQACNPESLPELMSVTAESYVFEALIIMEKSNSTCLTVINSNQVPIGTISYKDIALSHSGLPAAILMDISNSTNKGQVIKTLNQLPLLIQEMTRQGTRPHVLGNIIGRLFDSAAAKFMALSLDSMDEPPCEFAFMNLGSNARHEMTLFSDQDNALIFADTAAEQMDSTRQFFLDLADKVCTSLDEAGYPFCPGGIMASNPKWCLSVTEWKRNFKHWLNDATFASILEVNVFFDINCTYGQTALIRELQDYIFTLSQGTPQFFIHFARNCLLYKPPINILGHLRTEKKDGVKSLNIKDCLKPLEIFARIYALQHNVSCPGTLPRLNKLALLKIIPETMAAEITYIFNYLWQLRFNNQITAHIRLKNVNDELNLKNLTELERQNLTNVISRISNLQTKLSYDFLGGER